MIEYDYHLQELEADGRINEYRPKKIPKSLPNIVFIEGPNDSGKSTLLNVIALGLFGQQNKSIHESLQVRMKDLMNPNFNKLIFNVNISNNNSTLQIVSSKNNATEPKFEMYEIENGKRIPLIDKSFEQKYNLIYDIPSDPIVRLTQLTKEIRTQQERYAYKVLSLEKSLEMMVQTIRSTKNPQEIENLRIELQKLKDETTQKRNELEGLQNKHDKLEKYGVLKYYQEYFVRCENAAAEISSLTNKLKFSNRTKNVRNDKVDQYREESLENISLVKEKYTCLTSLLISVVPKTEEKKIKIWMRQEGSFDSVLTDYKYSDGLKREINHFSSILEGLIDAGRESELLKKATLYNEILVVLKKYESTNIKIPGVESSISELISKLRNENVENEAVLVKYDNIKRTKELLIELNDLIRDGEAKLQKLKEFIDKTENPKEYGSDNEDLKARLEKRKEEFDELNDSCNRYRQCCIQKKIAKEFLEPEDEGDFNHLSLIVDELCQDKDVFPYVSYTESQLLKLLEKLTAEIKKLQDKLKSNDALIGIKQPEFDAISKKKPHPYQNHLAYFEGLLYKCHELQGKIGKDYADYIGLTEDPVNPKINVNDEKVKKYFTGVFKYLGRRVEYILHDDKKLKVEEVDVINKVVKTTEGTVRFINIGTGHNQAAYLLGKLDNTDKNRKIIALFDEVSMMDDDTLDTIFERLNQLYKEDRLLAGIVVRGSKRVSITSRIEA